MAYMGDRSYDTCPSDGSCGCYDNEPTSEDYPEPLDLEDPYVVPMSPHDLEQLDYEGVGINHG